MNNPRITTITFVGYSTNQKSKEYNYKNLSSIQSILLVQRRGAPPRSARTYGRGTPRGTARNLNFLLTKKWPAENFIGIENSEVRELRTQEDLMKKKNLHTSITEINVTLNGINLVKNILSCGVIHKGNFLTCNKVILLHVRKLPLWTTPQLKIFFTRFMTFNVTLISVIGIYIKVISAKHLFLFPDGNNFSCEINKNTRTQKFWSKLYRYVLLQVLFYYFLHTSHIIYAWNKTLLNKFL